MRTCFAISRLRALLAPTDDRIGQDCCTCSQPLLALVSAGALMWRLFVELHHGKLFSERAERTRDVATRPPQRKRPNAQKHGAFSATPTIRGEDPRDFIELHSTLIDEWQPSGPTEEDAVFRALPISCGARSERENSFN